MPLSSGSKLGVYEIISPLGAGGMGEVYRARHTKLERDVAIKVLSAEFASNNERLRRFEQEARSASALNHPNIVVIHDIGQLDTTSYIVMELVEGKTLRELLSSGALPIKKTLQLAAQIADGLAKAHSAGIVHRDLKPENVMVSKEGYVKILDFGLAKLAPAAGDSVSEMATLGSPQTQAGVVMGTVGYMSPEQARGTAVDFRADQFSLGALLYEMVTGKRPFHRDSAAQTLAAIIEADPPNAAEINPRTPLPLRWIIERCLAKDPEDRYASTRDLARDLQSVRDHLSEAGTSTAQQMVAQPAPVARRRVLQFAAVALVMLFIGAALGFLFARPEPLEPPALRSLTFSGSDAQPSVSPDGRTVAFVSARDGVPRIWLRQLSGGGEAPLTPGLDFSPRFSPDGTTILFTRMVLGQDAAVGQRPPSSSAASRGPMSLYRIPVVGGEPRKLVDDATEGDWSPDGRQVVFLRPVEAGAGRTNVEVGIVPSDGGELRIIRTVDRALVYAPRWSPDGKRILVAITAAGTAGGNEARGLIVMNADGGENRFIAPSTAGGDISAPAWIGDSDKVVYTLTESASRAAGSTTNSTRVVLQDIGTGKGSTLMWLSALVNGVDVAGPGRLVFDYRNTRSNVSEFDLRARSQDAAQRWLTRGGSIDRQPIYSPDGKWVAFTSNRNGNLDIWAVSTDSAVVRPLTDHPADDWDPGFSRDGSRILFSSNRSGHFEVWMADADGSRPRQISSDGVDAENPTATPDGKWVVYNSGNPKKQGVWKVREDGTDAALLAAGSTAWPEVSPDGQFALYSVTGAQQNRVRVVRIADGQQVPFEIMVPVPGTGRARWMPGGRTIGFVASENGNTGVFVQDFIPGQDTSHTRRKLAGFRTDMETESFAPSSDGTRVAASMLEGNSSLMVADGVPGIVPPKRKK